MKISDFNFIKGYGYAKIDRLVMEYNDSKDLRAMLKAAQKFKLQDKVIHRVHHRFNKLRMAEERKELLKRG